MSEQFELKFNQDNLLDLPLKEFKECSICLEQIESEYELCSLKCGHLFHDKCMQKHKEKSTEYKCCMCRTPLDRPEFTSYDASELYKNETNYNLVFKKWLDASKQGDGIAACNLGMLYSLGRGCDKSDLQSCKWFCISAYKNISQGQFNLAIYFRKTLIDYEKSIYWFKKSAENKNIEALYTLGVIYYEGTIVEQNIDESIKYYKLAADNGHPLAQYNLSLIYWDEPHKNLKLHIDYLMLAVNNNIAVAIHNLAYHYEHGLNDDNYVIEQNIDEAIKLYRKAANLGLESSAYSLAVIYDTYYSNLFPQLYFPFIVKMLLNSAEKNFDDAITILDDLNLYREDYY